MFNKIKNILIRYKYKKFNFENFSRLNFQKKFVMVEFNAFNEFVCLSIRLQIFWQKRII